MLASRRMLLLLAPLAAVVMVIPFGTLQAQQMQSPAPVLQTTPQGTVDWTQGMITAIGEGAVPTNMPTPGAGRLMAIRAAKLDAMRNLLEMIQGVTVTSQTTVRNMMLEDDEIKTRVDGVLQGAVQVGEPIYLSDTTVRVTVAIPLSDNLANAVLPPTTHFNMGAPAEFPAVQMGGTVFTGLVIDATGLKVKPAMAPRIVDPEGHEVYGTGKVNREYAVQQGLVGYARSVQDAERDSRVTDHPLVVKGSKAMGTRSTDVEIPMADAQRIREASQNLSFIEQCRVMIVVD